MALWFGLTRECAGRGRIVEPKRPDAAQLRRPFRFSFPEWRRTQFFCSRFAMRSADRARARARARAREGVRLIDPPRARPHSAPLYVDRADPEFLHHRAYRSREDDALGSIA